MASRTQQEYRLNHSELRKMARSSAAWRGISKSTALADVCKDRAHWLGDKWSKPIDSAGARAALQVLRDCGGDAMPYLERARAAITAEHLPTFLRARHGMRKLWTARRA